MNPLPMTPVSHSKSGIVFLAHGTSNVEAGALITQSLEGLAQRFSETVELPQKAVVYSFLEILKPSLGEALDSLCAQGKTEIRILPLLLFPGNHLNHDIPRIAREVTDRYPGVRINIGACIGVEEPEFMDILLKRL